MSTSLSPSIIAVVLITQMGSPRYREREIANCKLQQLSPLVIEHLKAARDLEDAEISLRAAHLVARYFDEVADELSKRIRPTKWPRLPWLDMLPQDHPDRQQVIQQFVREAQERIGRKGPPDWPDYRLATQLYVHRLFQMQHHPEQVRRMLDAMAEQEREWIIRNRNKYSPPLELPK